VDSVNADGTTTGDTWTFTTAAAPPIPAFAYAPDTAIITWEDMNGAGQTGNLAFFNATADIASVTSVELISQSLTSISNLNLLPALNYLDIDGNAGVTALDLTGCGLLATLNFPVCNVASVDLSPCTLLLNLDCANNGILALDVSANTLLQFFNCSGNLLIALDVTALTALQVFVCAGNPIAALDVTFCPDLFVLIASSCELTTLDLSSCPIMQFCYCDDNLLVDVEVDNVLCDLATGAMNLGELDIFANAVPTAAGLACSATLEGVPRGPWIVNHD
jgi:Leucine-rich repeat (LRR) protein